MMRSVASLVLVVTLVVPHVLWSQETSDPNSPREVALVIHPARIDVGRPALTLLPKAEDLMDEEGTAFYAKAAQTLPPSLQQAQLTYWVNEPFNSLVLDQADVQAALQQAKASIEWVERGASCKNCNWPAYVLGRMPANLSEYRRLQHLLCLRARIEIVQSQFDKAARTIGIGLAMSKHFGEGPTAVQGMTGAAMATLLLRPVDDWVQVRGSPNLYSALHALPRPVVDVNVGISAEMKTVEASPKYDAMVKWVYRRQMQSTFALGLRWMERLEGFVAALECIEGLRHFTACHDGRLPAQLGDVMDIELPNDPATGKSFAYHLEGTRAILEVAPPKDGGPRDSVRYEITVAP